MTNLDYYVTFTITADTPGEASELTERLGSVMMGYVLDGKDCTLSVRAYDDDEEIGEAHIDTDDMTNRMRENDE